MLGLPLVERTDVANVYDAGGTPLRVTRVDGSVAAGYTVLGSVVSDIGAWFRDPDGNTPSPRSLRPPSGRYR